MACAQAGFLRREGLKECFLAYGLSQDYYPPPPPCLLIKA